MGSVAVRFPLGACRPFLASRNSALTPITCSGDASSKAAARRKPLAAPPSAQRGGEPGPLSSLLQPFQTTSQDRSEVASAPQLSPATLLLAAGGGLAVVAGDVFAADSLHLMAFIDASAHAWVSTTAALYPAELQSLVAGKLMSDAAIVAGLAGWAAVTAAALQARSPRLLQALAASVGAYWLGGGRLWGSDPLLVDALKHAFQRARPSEHHHTFAFPSGHTTAASFVCGTLLFVLLPLALEALEQQWQPVQQHSRGSGKPAAAAAPPAPLAWALQRRWQLWGGAIALTACGRVLADKHWVSDTMAGACLGAALVGALALVCGIRELSGSPPASDLPQQEGSRRPQ